MPPPPKRVEKPVLLKLFILDAQGGYAGEYAVDEDCVVEYGDFLSALPEAGLADQQSMYMGEYRATAFQGEGMGLVAISKGALGPEELAWVRATLIAAEAHLTVSPGAAAAPTGPDKAVLESLSNALEKREAELAERETALAVAEERTKHATEESRRAMEPEIHLLRKQLAEARLQLEQERNRTEVERVAEPPAPPPGTAPDLEAGRQHFERDRRMLQRRALDLLDREERVREREMRVAGQEGNLERLRTENTTLRAELEAAKKAASPAFDVEAARREIEMRVKVLQLKALDLLDREEKLRKAQEELRRARGA